MKPLCLNEEVFLSVDSKRRFFYVFDERTVLA